MKHLSEEELVDHHYGESDDPAASAQHLGACAECAAAFAALRRDLAAEELAPTPVPVRDAAYGEQVWETLRASLPVYEKQRAAWLRIGLWRGLGFAAAFLLLVAAAFYAGRSWEHKQQAANTSHDAGKGRQPVVLVVLSDHLDRSERLLIELKHADVSSAEMTSPMRDEARSLLAANRICRQDAAQIDDPALASALERLDHVLGELASEPAGVNAQSIQRLQDEMNEDSLLFEVRVLRSRMLDQPKSVAAQNGGGKI